MAMRDEIRAEREKLRGQSLRKRLGYFYDYYKLPFFAVLLLLLLGTAFLRELTSRKPTGFYMLFLNAEPVGDAQLAALSENWYSLLGLDEGKQEITVDAVLRFDPEAGDEAALAGTMRVTALLASRSADICISDPKLFCYYAESGAFLDLRELYSEEELAAYADRLCYIDRQEISSEDAEEDKNTENTGTLIRSPEGMAEPLPVGLVCEDGVLQRLGLYRDTAVFSVFANSRRQELARRLLDCF